MELKLHSPIRLHGVHKEIFSMWMTDTECVESGVRFIIRGSRNSYKEQLKGKLFVKIKSSSKSYLTISNISDRRPSLEL